MYFKVPVVVGTSLHQSQKMFRFSTERSDNVNDDNIDKIENVFMVNGYSLKCPKPVICIGKYISLMQLVKPIIQHIGSV